MIDHVPPAATAFKYAATDKSVEDPAHTAGKGLASEVSPQAAAGHVYALGKPNHPPEPPMAYPEALNEAVGPLFGLVIVAK